MIEWQTRWSKAQSTPDRWRETYGKGQYGTDKLAILVRLEALGPSPDPDEVDRIIGNPSWTECKCNACGEVTDAVCVIGERPDWESATAWVCDKCLIKAMALKPLDSEMRRG